MSEPEIITVQCGGCNKSLRVKLEHVGKSVRCKQCGAKTRIEAPSQEPDEFSAQLVRTWHSEPSSAGDQDLANLDLGDAPASATPSAAENPFAGMDEFLDPAASARPTDALDLAPPLDTGAPAGSIPASNFAAPDADLRAAEAFISEHSGVFVQSGSPKGGYTYEEDAEKARQQRRNRPGLNSSVYLVMLVYLGVLATLAGLTTLALFGLAIHAGVQSLQPTASLGVGTATLAFSVGLGALATCVGCIRGIQGVQLKRADQYNTVVGILFVTATILCLIGAALLGIVVWQAYQHGRFALGALLLLVGETPLVICGIFSCLRIMSERAENDFSRD